METKNLTLESPEETVVQLVCAALAEAKYDATDSQRRHHLARLFLLLDVLPAAHPGPPDAPLLAHLIEALRTDLKPDLLLTPWLARFGVDALGRPKAFQKMMNLCFKGFTSNYLNSRPKAYLELASGLIAVAPFQYLALWDKNGETHGASLLRHILHTTRLTALIDPLAARGILLSMPHAGSVLAADIKTPLQWTAFLRQKGNPNLPVTSEGYPLWAHLLKTRETVLEAPIRAWLALHASAAASTGCSPRSALAERDYLGAFYTTPRNRAAMLQHLFSRYDWADITDRDGAPAWARAALVVPAIVASLLKSHPEVLRRPDACGRSPWQYLLQTASATHAPHPGEALRSLGAESFQDAAGRGLLLQLTEPAPQLKKSSGRDGWYSGLSAEWWVPSLDSRDGNSWLKNLPVEAWVAGSVQQYNEAALRILASPSLKPFAAVARLAIDVPGALDKVSPLLRGAFAATLIATDPSGVFAPTGCTPVPHTTAERLLRLMNERAIHTADGVAHVEKALEKELARPGPAPSRPRDWETRFRTELLPFLRTHVQARTLDMQLPVATVSAPSRRM